MSARVLGGLDEHQREAVTALRGPVVVLAGSPTAPAEEVREPAAEPA